MNAPGKLLISGILLALALTAHAGEKAEYIKFEGGQLSQGRDVWLETCESCHGYGIAGAPIPMEPEEWSTRLEQEKTVLYEHAIAGFFGPGGTMMPPRGGNDKLTDAQVKAAVDYMTTLARHYIDQQEKAK
ncbi:MAG: c-type cytochrome [Thiotrichales bacterium]